jgi:hypothetical protein
MKIFINYSLLRSSARTFLFPSGQPQFQAFGSRYNKGPLTGFLNKPTATWNIFRSPFLRHIISGLTLSFIILSASTAFAQKVENKKIWTTYHKSPIVALKPNYSSFSIEYDFGDMVVPAGEKPALQGLEYKKSGGELVLKMTVKNVYSSDKELKQVGGNRPGVYYIISYQADYGYDLIQKETGTAVASYKRSGGTFTTQSFGSKTELDIYLKNAFVGDVTKFLVQKVNKRVDYDLSAGKYEVRLLVNTIGGTSPAYQEINKATSDFTASVSASEPDKERLRSAVKVWENQLKKANWEDKRSEINKKAANALIENLCAAYLLLEDYPELVAITDLSEAKNKGLLANLFTPSFDIDDKYPGPCSSSSTLVKNGRVINYNSPKYVEFASDFASK